LGSYYDDETVPKYEAVENSVAGIIPEGGDRKLEREGEEGF
jgi:hypothetical protein